MNKLYEWCTSLSETMRGSYEAFYNDYFTDGSVLTTVFLIGLGIALIISLVYYLVICNFSFKLSKRWFWLIILVATGILSMFISEKKLVGRYDFDREKCTGIYKSVYGNDGTRERLLYMAATEEDRNQIESSCAVFSNDIREGSETIFAELSLVNALYSIIIFVVFSILFKRFSTHGKAIPW